MNGQMTSLKTTWLRFQLMWSKDGNEEFVWIDLSQLAAIREYTSLSGQKQSVLVMRGNLKEFARVTVLGWAGDRLREVQDSQ